MYTYPTVICDHSEAKSTTQKSVARHMYDINSYTKNLLSSGCNYLFGCQSNPTSDLRDEDEDVLESRRGDV